MGKRSYTIDEVDEMRMLVRAAIVFDAISINPPLNRFPLAGEREVENRLRTYMLADTEPLELRHRAVKAALLAKTRLNSKDYAI